MSDPTLADKIEQRVRIIRRQDAYSKQVGHAQQLGFLVEAEAEPILCALRDNGKATSDYIAAKVQAARDKALAETLAGALGEIAPHVNWMPHPHCLTVEQLIRKTLRQYKEARDAS